MSSVPSRKREHDDDDDDCKRQRNNSNAYEECLSNVLTDYEYDFVMNLFRSAQDGDGFTPLHLAVRDGKDEQVLFYLNDVGVPVNVKDKHGMTALNEAMRRNNLNYETMTQLIRQSDVDLVDNNGFSPLHHAVASRNTEGLNILYMWHRNIDVNVTNIDDETPLQMAERLGDIDICTRIKCLQTLNRAD